MDKISLVQGHEALLEEAIRSTARPKLYYRTETCFWGLKIPNLNHTNKPKTPEFQKSSEKDGTHTAQRPKKWKEDNQRQKHESNLEMESSSTELTAALVVELNPSGVLVKARALPLQAAIEGGSVAYESREEIHRAAEGVEDGPWQLPWQQGKDVHRVER